MSHLIVQYYVQHIYHNLFKRISFRLKSLLNRNDTFSECDPQTALDDNGSLFFRESSSSQNAHSVN